MPYQLFQGGRRHRRRRWPTVLAVLALLGVGGAAARILWHGDTRRAPQRAAPPAAPALADGAPAPLAGGGTAPSPLSVRLDDPRDLVRLRFKHPPRSGLLFDLDTGRVLWRRDPTRVLPIASLTKMMTALLVARRVPRGSKVRIPRQSLSYRGSGVGLFRLGRRIGVETMLNGLLLPSGNAAAIALAQRVSGTLPRFVALMNGEARAMGLACTRFSSPDGFRNRGNHSWPPAPPPPAPAPPPDPRPRPPARAAPRAHRAPPAGHPAVPDQGRPDLPLQPQPAAPAGLPRRHRGQDRLHRRGGALPRGQRAPRDGAPRRRAAALARPGDAGAQAARPRVPARPLKLSACAVRRRAGSVPVPWPATCTRRERRRPQGGAPADRRRGGGRAQRRHRARARSPAPSRAARARPLGGVAR